MPESTTTIFNRVAKRRDWSPLAAIQALLAFVDQTRAGDPPSFEAFLVFFPSGGQEPVDEAPAERWHPTANEHPMWIARDWKYEVVNGDTVLGYHEWVEHQVEAARTDRGATRDDG